MPIQTSILGFSRIGHRRELKIALEKFWSGAINSDDLLATAAEIRQRNWLLLKDHSLSIAPSNDFSLYDQVLDTSVMLGAIPPQYGRTGGPVPLETYFAMARGTRGEGSLPALEMTKWFDTNYHYMVPELKHRQEFCLASTKAVDEYQEARALGIHTRPVLLGPVTWLKLAKAKEADLDPVALLPGILPVYEQVLRDLVAAGADWVQIDEPGLVLDLDAPTRAALETAYHYLATAVPAVKILLASYFGSLGENMDLAAKLPVAGLHLDLVRGAEQLDPALAKLPHDLTLSLGLIDGRNIWRANLPAVLDRLEPVLDEYGADRFMVGTSCSLLHVPVDLNSETSLDPDLKSWLAFAVQKVDEVVTLGKAIDQGRHAVQGELDASVAAVQSRRVSLKTHNDVVRARTSAIASRMKNRSSTFQYRRKVQKDRLALPDFPTTTIGSFPQTSDVRKARAEHGKGQITDTTYEDFLRRETEQAIRLQEEIGLDVLVHGEFERNDMVQYFGEQLEGFAFTKNGWVQSYGSRCVRPPIIFGDVSRPRPMTVAWSSFAQALTDKPMKGMLTGPVTMLQWSFVRDDQPRSVTCQQIALALRDEVMDLEKAGISIIQIDEPALREGLPLRHSDWKAYLDWAVGSFKLASSGVSDTTQIHTHMCYSEFNDIIDSIGAMDADVISIETARSKMELLEAFSAYRYPNEIGPGVYDIHSPRCPSVEEITRLLSIAEQRLGRNQIWVNPDCGLKTRSWAEIKPALANMVEAARSLRE